MAVMKQLLFDDEDEVLYLLVSTLQDEAAEARSGEMRAGKDELVANYLTGRAKTLENALRVIQRQNPNLEML
jgi:CheY-like chemotaxis protein